MQRRRTLCRRLAPPRGLARLLAHTPCLLCPHPMVPLSRGPLSQPVCHLPFGQQPQQPGLGGQLHAGGGGGGLGCGAHSRHSVRSSGSLPVAARRCLPRSHACSSCPSCAAGAPSELP